MAFDAVKITFNPAEWGEAVAADLMLVEAFDKDEIAAIENLITAGDFQLLEINAGADRVGSLVWSIASEDGGPVMVINSLAASTPVQGVDLWRVVNDRFTEFAAATGCKALRCWTRRRGLVRLVESAGWQFRAYVMEKEISHGF